MKTMTDIDWGQPDGRTYLAPLPVARGGVHDQVHCSTAIQARFVAFAMANLTQGQIDRSVDYALSRPLTDSGGRFPWPHRRWAVCPKPQAHWQSAYPTS